MWALDPPHAGVRPQQAPLHGADLQAQVDEARGRWSQLWQGELGTTRPRELLLGLLQSLLHETVIRPGPEKAGLGTDLLCNPKVSEASKKES